MTDCCNGASAACGSGETRPCASCHRSGNSVTYRTMEALVRPEDRAGLTSEAYRFCETPTCPVVYYSNDGMQVLKHQLRVRVGLKETEDPISVCYCFNVTERMIREEIERTGHSTASTRIRAEVKDGNCCCEVENPSGRCCLGDVIQAEKSAEQTTR